MSAINWKQVTTEDLRTTFVNYPLSVEAISAVAEYTRRCGEDYFTANWRRQNGIER